MIVLKYAMSRFFIIIVKSKCYLQTKTKRNYKQIIKLLNLI